MPEDTAHYVKYLNSFQMDAVVINRPKIAKVARAYRDKRLDLSDAERMASLLASKNKKARERGNDIYQHFLDRGLVGLKDKLKPKPRTEKRQTFSIKVILFTSKEKRDREHIDGGDDENPRYERYKRYLKKTFRSKFHIFWVGNLHVTGVTRKFLTKHVDQLVERGKKDWQDLYRACMTDDEFRNRELLAPGYVEALMVLGVDDDYVGPVVDPAEEPMAAAGDKVTITYRYCSNVLDLTKDTFAEAVRNERYLKNECFINSLYDFYGDKLLDPKRAQRYRISREDILKILGKTKEGRAAFLREVPSEAQGLRHLPEPRVPIRPPRGLPQQPAHERHVPRAAHLHPQRQPREPRPDPGQGRRPGGRGGGGGEGGHGLPPEEGRGGGAQAQDDQRRRRHLQHHERNSPREWRAEPGRHLDDPGAG
jgi:hypothetical protein